MFRKKRLVLFMILSAFLTANQAQAQSITIRVLADEANIRLHPSFESDVIVQVSLGTVFENTQQSGDWYLVSLRIETSGDLLYGYIHKSFVEEMKRGGGETERKIPIQKIEEIPFEQVKTAQKRPTMGQSGFGIKGGYTLFTNNNLSSNGSYGISLVLGFFRYLSLEANGIYSVIPMAGSEQELQKGQVTLIPIQVSLFFRLPIANLIVPYLGGGAGYYFVSKQAIDRISSGAWEDLGFQIRENLAGGWGYHGALGFDIFLNDHIAFNIEGRYCLVKLDSSWSILDTITSLESSGELSNIDFSRITIGGGLKFLF